MSTTLKVVGVQIVAVTREWEVVAGRRGHQMAEVGKSEARYDRQVRKTVMVEWRRSKREKG